MASKSRKKAERTGGEAPASRTSEKGRWIAAGLALLFVFSYAPVLDPALNDDPELGFIWDDDSYVEFNPELRHLEGLRRIWFEPGAIPQYYPLVHSSFWLEYRLWGPRPFGYHVVNVLLHGLAALLLYRVLAGFGLPGASLATALFLLHPVQVETVAWVTERKNVLSMVFALLAVLAWRRAAPDDARERWPRWTWLGLAFLAFAAALLSKTVTATLPAALLLLAWWRSGRVPGRAALSLLPFFALGIGLGLNTAAIEASDLSGTGQGATGEAWEMSALERVLLAGRVSWFYFGKLLVPAPLTFIYPRWEVDAGVVLQWAFPIALVGVLALLFLLRGRIGRGPLSVALLFLGTLFPALGFFDVWPFQYSYVADHFQYHATVAIFAGLGVLGHRGLARLRGAWRPAIPLGVAVLASLLSHAHARDFRSVEALWRDTIDENPRCWMALNNLGEWSRQRGLAARARGDSREAQQRFEEAEQLFGRALEVKQSFPEARLNRSALLIDMQRIEEGERELRALLEEDPRNAEARVNLGVLHAQRGEFDAARARWRAVLEDEPDHLQSRVNLAKLAQQEGAPQRAAELLRDGLEHLPRLPHLHLELALAEERLAMALGRGGEAAAAEEARDRARQAFRRARELACRDPRRWQGSVKQQSEAGLSRLR